MPVLPRMAAWIHPSTVRCPGIAFHRTPMASLRRHGSYPPVLGRPPARNDRRRLEGQFLRRDGIARVCWPLCHPLAIAMWRALILFVLLLVAGCQHGRPDFMTRVMEDCAAGDQWACDLLDSLAKALTRPDRHPAQHRHRRTKFDGGVMFGRNASGNNTVFLYAWMAF